MTISPVRAALAVGLVFGLWHLAWAALVASGWAKTLLDFVLWAHFLKVAVGLDAFDPSRAAILVAVTFAVGAVLGWLFAIVWNRLHRRVGA
jgi:membrane protease YdiL (CAAX protease family)